MLVLGSVTGVLLINTGHGGDIENFIDVRDKKCRIGEGLLYVNTTSVKTKISSFFTHKTCHNCSSHFSNSKNI